MIASHDVIRNEVQVAFKMHQNNINRINNAADLKTVTKTRPICVQTYRFNHCCYRTTFITGWQAFSVDACTHCTDNFGLKSPLHDITASIIQGSAIGPVAYVVNATVTPGNAICKYADDSYLITPAENVGSRQSELSNVVEWSQANDLTLNHN